MKNLEFRIWDKIRNFYVYSGNLAEVISQLQWVAEPNTLDIDMENSVTEQYTGLEDKNGVKIFEGDIVRYYQEDPFDNVVTDAILLCKYTLDNAWFSFYSSFENNSDGYYWQEIKENCEVVGNVHENPELKLKYR